MKSFTLLKECIKNCTDWELIKTIGSYFLLLVGIFNFIEIPIFFLLSSIAAPFFTVILLTALRTKYENILFSLPNRQIFLTKVWKVFSAGFISGLFIFLGLCLFIVPGIFLAKRYLYVGVVAEHEMLGPIDSMRRSNELSQANGWFTLVAFIYLGLFSALSMGFVSIISSTSIETLSNNNFSALILDWITLITGYSISFLGFKEASNAYPILKD